MGRRGNLICTNQPQNVYNLIFCGSSIMLTRPPLGRSSKSSHLLGEAFMDKTCSVLPGVTASLTASPSGHLTPQSLRAAV